MNTSDKNTCLICKDICDNILLCGHYYHSSCLLTWFNSCHKYKCLYCCKNLDCKDLLDYVDLNTFVLSELETNMELVSFVYKKTPYIFTAELYVKFIKADNIEVIKLLDLTSFRYSYIYSFIIACEYSSIEVIEYFDAKNNNNVDAKYIADILYSSILDKNIVTFDYIITNYSYCRDNTTFSKCAVLSSNLCMLKHLINADFTISSCLMSKAIIINNLKMVKFLYKINNYSFEQNDRVRVASHGHVEILEYLSIINPDMFDFTINKISVAEMDIILKTCNKHMFDYLYGINILCNDTFLTNACFNLEHIYIMSKLYEYGCEFTQPCFENICALNLNCIVDFMVNSSLSECIMQKLLNVAYEYKNETIVYILFDYGYNLM
jgi:hypothetical protein